RSRGRSSIRPKKNPQTPAALVRWGTRPYQETIAGKLENIYQLAEKHNLKPPLITIIGGVVNLRNKLRWFDNKPLFGKTILITRSREQASIFSQSLEELGAYCLEYPLIKIVPLENKTRLNKALINLKKYDWLIFTSQNAVNHFIKYLKDLRKLSGIKIAVIGSSTAKALENYYIKADLIPKKFIAESLIKEFKKINLKNKNILIPRAEAARDILPEELKSQGANVEVIPIYKTILEEDEKEELIKLFKENKINLITFTSSSTVKNFDGLIGKEIKDLLKNVKILCIGPITAKTAYDLGYKVNALPEEYSISGMVKECLKLFSKGGN
ncbi:MAG: uroporphyrinogen-III synthase, partial [Armatimonadetes bacterium]|nr:uroporphyrinogen-III synthase [Armatimonadota bacterium]